MSRGRDVPCEPRQRVAELREDDRRFAEPRQQPQQKSGLALVARGPARGLGDRREVAALQPRVGEAWDREGRQRLVVFEWIFVGERPRAADATATGPGATC